MESFSAFAMSFMRAAIEGNPLLCLRNRQRLPAVTDPQR
jgi:hypothetical protein